jgi:type VI secretion system protein ImpG
MDDLLRYFEEELGLFGQYAREFRERFPKPAGNLHIAGETYEDPSVARLIESVALMSARIKKRLDDDYPKFTESLLECLYPHYLRPLPAYSVVHIAPDKPAGSGGTRTARAPRGTMLRTRPGQGPACRFRTVYPVSLGDIDVRKAFFAAVIAAPRSLRLPRGVTSSIGIELAVGDKASLADLGKVRVYVDCEPSQRAALLDTLFMRAVAAYVQPGDGQPWVALERLPVRLAGFADDEAMIPFPARSNPAFRLLTEYFTYPEKFNFVDLDFGEIAARLPASARRLTLHLALRGVLPDSNEARLLSSLSEKNLLLGCTPIINLFDKAGDPLQLTQTRADYALSPDGAHASAYEIHSIDAVRVIYDKRGSTVVKEFGPLYAVRYGDAAAAQRGNFWFARRDETTASVSPGHEVRIALVDADFNPSDVQGATLSTDLTCTNRDLPSQLRHGNPEGDLRPETESGLGPIRLLRRPTPTYRFDAGKGAHWRLISHLALNYATLTNAGLADFQKMLSLYDLPRSPISQRQIAGVVGLEHGTVRAWIRTLPASSLMPGIGIRMTVDEQAFVGSSLYVFAQVMDRYFAMNGQINCFTQLEIVSEQTGEEILKCPPRTAEQTRA